MSNQPKKPIPLNYARPGTNKPATEPDAAPALPPGFNRGTLTPTEATAAIFETTDRGDMAFATRALDQQSLPYHIADVPVPHAAYKHPIRLLVREADAQKVRDILNVVLVRRLRAKKLHEKKPDGFKTVSEGGTWPDPYSRDGWGTGGGGFFGGF